MKENHDLSWYIKKCGEAANKKGWKITWEILPEYLMATIDEICDGFEDGWRGGDKESLVYIAGFMDGEGCISFSKKNTSYNVHINISNTNRNILNWIQKTLKERGIIMKLYPKKKEKATDKQGYRLECFKMEDVKKLLGLLFPYLKGKRKQALLVLEFLIRREKERAKKYRAHLSKRELEIVTEVHNLNHQEVVEIPLKDGKDKFNEEIGDCLVRLFHMCYDLNIPIEDILQKIMEENEKRPYKHGHKRI